MKVKCYKCGNIWEYEGDKKHYITCTDCHNSIKKDKARKEYQKEEGNDG